MKLDGNLSFQETRASGRGQTASDLKTRSTDEQSRRQAQASRHLKAYKPTEFAKKLMADQELFQKDRAGAIQHLCKNVLDQSIRMRTCKEQAEVIARAFDRKIDFESVLLDFNRFWANRQRYDHSKAKADRKKQQHNVEMHFSEASLAEYRSEKRRQKEATQSYLEVQRFIKELQAYTDPKITKQELVQSMARDSVVPPMTLAEAENPLNKIFKGYVGKTPGTVDKLVPDPFAEHARTAIAPGQGGKSLLMDDQAFVVRDEGEEDLLKTLAAERINLKSQYNQLKEKKEAELE